MISRFGWQALLLVPLIVLIFGLWRVLRRRPGARLLAPGTRFLLVSILAHVGLLFALDLVLISIPVVEAHKGTIEAAIVKTFSLFPSARGGTSPSWERLPEGPPPADPPVEPTASRVSAPRDVAFDPALKGIAPTIPEALARTLPPDRVLFLPRPAPEFSDARPSDLPRAVAVEPELPVAEPPALARIAPPPEPAPVTPATTPDRRTAEPRTASAPEPVAVPSVEPRFLAPVAAHIPEREPDATMPSPILDRQPADLSVTLPDVTIPPVAAVSEQPVPPLAEAPSPLPKATVKEMDLPRTPQPSSPREIARLDPPLRALETPRDLPPIRLDTVTVPLPEMRLPSTAAALAMPVEPADLLTSFALRTPEVRKDVVKAMGGSEASEAAVERGLSWLAAHQGSAGNWSFEDLHCQGHKCDAAGVIHSDGAATGLALMALLGAGHSPGKGAHATAVRRGADWLVAHQSPDGSLAEPSGSQMYGHALATIALCEAFGLSAEPALRAPAERAIKFIVNAQDTGNGGWRYTPRSGGDTSVFGWQLMALKSAEMAGLPVPAETYRRASRWLDSVTAGPGKTLYGYQPGREATPSMTAEALLCRQYLGGPRPAGAMAAGGRYLRSNLPAWNDRHLYYWYYATQVMFHLQGDDWAAWNGKLRDMLVDSQDKTGPSSGSWHPQRPSPDRRGERGGRIYETALSLLILEVYYRHLPLYQQLSGSGMDGPG